MTLSIHHRGLADVGDHPLEHYARQGLTATEAHVAHTKTGWLFEATAHNRDGGRYSISGTGRGLELTSEEIHATDDDPFDGLDQERN